MNDVTEPERPAGKHLLVTEDASGSETKNIAVCALTQLTSFVNVDEYDEGATGSGSGLSFTGVVFYIGCEKARIVY